MPKNGDLLVRIDERVHALSVSHEELKVDMKEIKDKLFKGSKKIGALRLMVAGLWSAMAVLAAGVVYLFKRLLG